MSDNGGVATFNGNATASYYIAHGCVLTPTLYGVDPGSSAAIGNYSITVDAIHIVVTYTASYFPPVGTNNVKFVWEAHISR